MIRSMTGYGRGENTKEDRKFTVEIKSVNHRYNDITIKLPRTMNYIEDTIKKKLAQQISRGKTDVYIFFSTSSKEDVKVSINKALVDTYIEKFRELKKIYNLKDDVSLSLLANLPDIITVEPKEIDTDIMAEILMPAVESALNEFIQLREREGATLKEDILIKLKHISEMVESIKVRSPKTVIEFKDRLQSRLNELLGNNKEIDEARIITEVTIFADRSSVDEEVIRLMSHIKQIETILDEKETIGRKLDFLIQEMNRESNTICSKSNDIEITQITVDLKSEIEKIREQVQNIE